MIAQRVRPGVQPVYSTALVLIGTQLAATPNKYPTEPYKYHFAVMPPQAWGLLLILVGAAAFGAVLAPRWRTRQAVQTHLAQFCCALQSAVLALWAFLLLAAAVDPNLSVTFNGPILWAASATANFVSLYRFGSGR